MLRRLSQSGTTLPTVIVFSLLVTAVSTIIHPVGSVEAEGLSLFCQLPTVWIPYRWLSVIIDWVLLVVGAIFLARLNYTYALIRTRTTLPFFFLVYLFTFTPGFMGGWSASHLVVLVIIILLFVLFSNYQQEQTQMQAFTLAFIITAFSFVVPDFILYLPVFVYAHYQMKSYRFKCFLATLVGIIAPVFLTFTYAFVFDRSFCVDAYFRSVMTVEWISVEQVTPLFLFFIFLSVVSVAFTLEGLLTQYTDKIQTRTYNGVVSLLSVYSIVLSLVAYDRLMIFLSVAGVCATLQMSRYFTYARGSFAGYIFLIVLLILLTNYTWNLLPV